MIQPMASPATASKPFFLRRWFLITCGLVLFYTLAGFFLVPAVLKSQLESKLPAMLHRNVTVQEVQINPYVLSLGIKGFEVTEPDGQPFASLEELFVNIQLSSLFQRSLNFKEIRLKSPAAVIALHPGGKTNFDDLLVGGGTEPPPPAEPSKPPKVNIEKLQIDNGGVAFADFTRTPNFETRIDPIQLSLTDFSTFPDANSPYSFSARTEPGAIVSWSGAFSVNPLRSNGVLTVGGVQLNQFGPYYAEFTQLRVADGEAGFRAEYRLDASSGPLDLHIDHASFELTHLKVTPPDAEEAVVAMSSLTVGDANVDLLKRLVTVGTVALDGGAILARRLRDGTLTLLTWSHPRPKHVEPPSPPKAEEAKADGAEPQDPWRLAVGDIILSDFSVTAEDAVPATPAKLVIDRINLKLNGLAFPDRTPIGTEASLRWNQTGTVAATGTLRHSPVAADLRIAVKDFDLRPFQPYVSEQANVQLAGGAANLQGHLLYGRSDAGAPLIRFTGEFALNDVAAEDVVSTKTLVAWDSFALTGIHADVSPTALAIDEIRLKKLKSSVVVAPDGRLNVTHLMRPSPERDAEMPPEPAKEPAKAESAPSAPIPISVKTVILDDATVAFTDRSIQPNYAAELRKLNGRIQGLSSQRTAKAKIDVTGKLDGHAPLHISGQLNPLSKNLFADLAFSLKSFDLPPLSPYTGKFAGYPLQKGKLSADLRYKVAERQMDGDNVVLVDQLTLGPQTDSPDATSLPVKLAIAILQDRQGKIHLDVPVSGKLDDPEFRLGKVIWGAFLNILEKVATSPFALVGAIAGGSGGGEELSVIAFEPGSAAPSESEMQKLDTLAKVLMERPGLNLEISGQADPEEDRPPLAKAKLRHFFQQQKLKAVKTKNPSLEEDIPLQDQEYERMVRLAYAALVKAEEQRSPSSPNAVPSGLSALSDDAFQEPEQKSGFWDFLSRLNPFKSGRASKKGPAQSASREDSEADFSGVPLADMEQRLMERQEVTEEDFNALKRERAQNVQSYLLKKGDLPAERLFIVAPKAEGRAGGDRTVTLALK